MPTKQKSEQQEGQQIRVAPEAIEVLRDVAQKTGRSMKQVLDDMVMRRDISAMAISAIQFKMYKTGWTFGETVEWLALNWAFSGQPDEEMKEFQRFLHTPREQRPSVPVGTSTVQQAVEQGYPGAVAKAKKEKIPDH